MKVHAIALVCALPLLAAVSNPARAQLQPAGPMSFGHTAMPMPSTEAPPVRMQEPGALPSLPQAPLPPQSPITQEVFPPTQHARMPNPAVVAPPIVMVPPNLLPAWQIPPGVPQDSTVPMVPVPAGTPLVPHS